MGLAPDSNYPAMQIEQINPPTESVLPGPPVIDYAPARLKSRFSPAQRSAIAVLAVGVVLYGIACIPSYSRSFWPPIDRLWEATPWLWVFPIPMFTLVMPGGSFARMGELPKYPGIYFIRCGKSVAVVTADGWVLQQVTDNR